MTDKQIINEEEAIKMIKNLNEKLKNVDDYVVELRSNFYRMKQDLDRKEQECEKAKQNAQDTYDLWQALIESFNILQGEKIKLEQECEKLSFDNFDLKDQLTDLKFKYKTINDVAKSFKQQLDQLKEELVISIQKNEEGREINAELKAENEELRRLVAKQKNAKIQLSKLKDKQYKEFCDMKQTLAEIKEIAEKGVKIHDDIIVSKQILQKISEVEDEKNM